MSDKRKILIRFDDICPTMNWKEWNKATELLEKYNIKPLLGVIPECKDPDLLIDSPREDFWDYLKTLQQKGYKLAMHGLYHKFDNECRGIVNNTYHTEFAGHSYEVQFEKIRKGKDILLSHGIETNVFFAPAHSYDLNTIKALGANGFKYMSDGLSIKPIERFGVVCVPCRMRKASEVRKKGYFTCVFHAHEWSIKKKIDGYNLFEKICMNYNEDIVDFNAYVNQPVSNSIYNKASESLLIFYRRKIFYILYRIYKSIMKRG